MKLTPLSPIPSKYHFYYKSFSEAMIYDDNLRTVMYGSPSICNAFISRFFKKSDTIYYYNNRMDNNNLVYKMTAMYEGKNVADEQTNNNDSVPKQSEKKATGG